LDKDGRGSAGPIVGLGRRKDKCRYRGPQAEEEENVDHGAHQRSSRHEETIDITHNYADIEKGVPDSNGTSLGVSNRGHCIDRGSQNIYGTNPGRMCKDGQ
jgi:hypothetical protein